MYISCLQEAARAVKAENGGHSVGDRKISFFEGNFDSSEPCQTANVHGGFNQGNI